MSTQCPTCGGKLAHYISAPAGYCVEHSDWYYNRIRCASASSEPCSDAWNGEDFGLVCPIDGTRIASAPEISPDDMQLVDEIKASHPEGTAAHSSDFQLKHIPLFLKQHREECADPQCPGSNVISVGGDDTRPVVNKNPYGALQLSASVQKTAMWYYLKPRWIIRRKAQAFIRHKVRTMLTPIAIKSSSVEEASDTEISPDQG